MATRQLGALEDTLPYWGLAAILCIAAGLTHDRQQGSGPGRLRATLLLIAALAAVAHAASLRWIGDDAFISFRYADNLVHGRGLVFNPGERVEGYTNFLWTMLMAAGLAVGLEPTWVSTALGLASFAALVLLTDRLTKRLRPDGARAAVPIAAFATSASYCLASYGTSGLETLFAATLVTLALERALAGSAGLAGLAGVLATLAHPDHAVLYAGLGAALLVSGASLRSLLRYAAPFGLLFVPYFFWRYRYYGDWVPNTFHTKSGHLTYFSQGALYLTAFVIGSGVWALLAAVPAGLAAARNRLFGAFLLFGIVPYVAYVAKIGGDFMYGRLLCVTLPPLMALAEVAVWSAFAAGRRGRATVLVLALAVTGAPVAVLGARHSDWHITDEGRFYRVTSLSPLAVDSYYFQVADDMRRYLTRLPVDPLVAFDCVGMTGYLSGLPLVDRWGLTDSHVARQPIQRRGRPGHEKRASPGYLLSRGVHFSDVSVFPERYGHWTQALIGKTRFYVVQHDPAVMTPLGRRHRVRLPSPQRALERLVRGDQRNAQAPQRACEAWVLDEVYVRRWGSPEQRRRLYAEMLVQSTGVTPSEALELGFDGSSSHQGDDRTALHFEPQAPGILQDDSSPARAVIARGPAAGQSEMFGQRGWFVNTFVPGKGDAFTTTLRTPPFELRGEVLELKVAGGHDAERLSVELRVDGVTRFSATGCQSELFGTRLWFIKPYRGRQAVLEIHDRHAGPWGHIMVDEVRQWLPRPGHEGNRQPTGDRP